MKPSGRAVPYHDISRQAGLVAPQEATEATPPTSTTCPPPRATASFGSTPPPRPAGNVTRRPQAIIKAIAAIDALNVRLPSPRCRIETAAGTEAEAREQIAELNATAGPACTLRRTPSRAFGRPSGAVRPQHRLHEDHPHPAADPVHRRRDPGRPRRRVDGMWPLITNDRDLSPGELFAV